MYRSTRENRAAQFAFLEALSNVSDNIFFIDVDHEGRLRFGGFSPAAEKAMGVTNQQVGGKLIEEATPPHVAECIIKNYRRCLETGAPLGYEEVLDLPIGRRHFQTNLFPVRDSSGRVYRIVGIARDKTVHTERVHDVMLLNRVYRVLSRTNELIVHEKNRGRLLQEVCRIAVEDGGAIMAWVGFVDAATRRVIPTAWYGKEEGYLTSIEVSAKDVPSGRGPAGIAVRENRHVFVADISEEPIMKRWREDALKRGYQSCAAFPLTEKGSAIGIFTTYSQEVGFFNENALSHLDELARDISYALENLKGEEEREKLQAQLQQAQKMEAVGRLAGGVAHDFNNILTAIYGYCDMGLVQTQKEQTLHGLFTQIRQAATRAANLTSQLLAFSRKRIIQPRTVNLGELVAGMMSMLRRLLGEDINVHARRSKGLWSVRADPGQIEQVVMNLVINSRDAMPTGGVLTIETANERLDGDSMRDHPEVKEGDYVLLAVADTGHGMDVETVRRIYEPFFTTKEAGKGTGLGLATVYGIVKQSDGYIYCDSEVGKGTTFKVYIPRWDGTEESTAQHDPHSETVTNGNETILFIDDDEAVRAIAASALQTAGYTVISGRDGYELLDAAASLSSQPDLLVTDVVMSGLSGNELARRLVEQFPAVRVLYMTGYTDDAIVHHGVLQEGIELLQKPFTTTELLHKVRSILGVIPRA